MTNRVRQPRSHTHEPPLHCVSSAGSYPAILDDGHMVHDARQSGYRPFRPPGRRVKRRTTPPDLIMISWAGMGIILRRAMRGLGVPMNASPYPYVVGGNPGSENSMLKQELIGSRFLRE